jgi:hypothetical protein
VVEQHFRTVFEAACLRHRSGFALETQQDRFVVERCSECGALKPDAAIALLAHARRYCKSRGSVQA